LARSAARQKPVASLVDPDPAVYRDLLTLSRKRMRFIALA
jgi:hypothetical protein